MGDPETQVVLPRVKNDLGELLLATAEGRLSQLEIEIDDRSYTTIVAVSGGYPDGYQKGKEITGLKKVKGCNIFHAGTTVNEGKTFTYLNGPKYLEVLSRKNARNLVIPPSTNNSTTESASCRPD